jgi:hypothetical protein
LRCQDAVVTGWGGRCSDCLSNCIRWGSRGGYAPFPML